MKKLLGIMVLGLLLSGNAYAENLKFTKIINLDKPWGSSFINKDELIITEKNGKIKIVNINSGEVLEVDHNLNFLKVGFFIIYDPTTTNPEPRSLKVFS